MKKLLIIFLIAIGTFSCAKSTSTISNDEVASALPTPEFQDTGPIPGTGLDEAPSEDITRDWKEAINRTQYSWDGKELYVNIPGKNRLELFRKIAKDYLSSFQSEGGRCLNSSYFKIAAVVGDLVSYSHESSQVCGTVQGEWLYSTVNVSSPTPPLDLKHMFSEEELFKALIANNQISNDIHKSINEQKLAKMPENFRELNAFLTKYDYQLFDGASFFGQDYLTRFAFHHLEENNVVIRIAASPTSTAGRAIHRYVEIKLPIPDSLRTNLTRANDGEAGFLMTDAISKVGTSPAVFEEYF